MKYTHVFFDLDGTLINSAPGIFRSIRYALGQMGLPEPGDLNRFVGPSLSWAFSEYCGISPEDGKRALEYYRVCYRGGAMLECDVYDGIPELLDELRARGVIPAVATCKPHVFATKILGHLGLLDKFDFVSGPEIDGTRGEKHEVIAYAMEHFAVPDPTRVLMLGDRAGDVTGALRCGTDIAGALWGFGGAKELTDAGAKSLCSRPADVLRLIGD